MRADSKQLRNFLTIVEQGSFTRAAEVVAMSQPALSASISQLERCLGVPVLDRSKLGAVPNGYGKLLVRHARAVTSALEHAEKEIALKRMGVSGPLSVGGTPVALNSLVPPALALLTKALGPLNATLYELVDRQLHDMLRNEEIDLAVGVVGLDAPEADIIEDVLIEARYDLVVAANHPLASRESIGIEEVADLPWVVPGKGGAFRRQVESLFATSGISFPAATITCESLATLKQVVQQTECVTVLPHPAIAAEREMGLLSIVRLEGKRAPRAFGCMRLRGRELSPQANAMIDAINEVALSRAGDIC